MSDLSTEDVHVQDAPLSRKVRRRPSLAVQCLAEEAFGGARAASILHPLLQVSNVSYQQVVWRTLKDFRELHGLRVAYYGSDVLPVFPKAASWVSSVLRGAHAVADELQRSLDVYMKVSRRDLSSSALPSTAFVAVAPYRTLRCITSYDISFNPPPHLCSL